MVVVVVVGRYVCGCSMLLLVSIVFVVNCWLLVVFVDVDCWSLVVGCRLLVVVVVVVGCRLLVVVVVAGC